jgi:hypothetical protein
MLQQWLETHQVRGVVVRPDRYVLGAARVNQDMEALAGAI